MRAMAAHTRHAAANLGLVHKILDVEPPPVLTSASRGQLQVSSLLRHTLGTAAGAQPASC